jgi:metal-dependent amidase/aminoacylase/carboxypeptidase family protein
MMAGRDSVKVTVERAPDPAATAAAVRDRIAALTTVTRTEAVMPAEPGFRYVEVRTRKPETEGGTWSVEGSVSTAGHEASARALAGIEAMLAELATGMANNIPSPATSPAERAKTRAGSSPVRYTNGLLGNDATTLTLEHEERFIAGIDNAPDLTARASAVIESVLGEGSVLPVPAVVPGFSEDFGSFQAQVPSVMFFLGVSNAAKGTVGMPHTPAYVADDEAIFVGARAMAAVLLDFLAAEPANG